MPTQAQQVLLPLLPLHLLQQQVERLFGWFLQLLLFKCTAAAHPGSTTAAAATAKTSGAAEADSAAAAVGAFALSSWPTADVLSVVEELLAEGMNLSGPKPVVTAAAAGTNSGRNRPPANQS